VSHNITILKKIVVLTLAATAFRCSEILGTPMDRHIGKYLVGIPFAGAAVLSSSIQEGDDETASMGKVEDEACLGIGGSAFWFVGVGTCEYVATEISRLVVYLPTYTPHHVVSVQYKLYTYQWFCYATRVRVLYIDCPGRQTTVFGRHMHTSAEEHTVHKVIYYLKAFLTRLD
jgi:hypothetical protein